MKTIRGKILKAAVRVRRVAHKVISDTGNVLRLGMHAALPDPVSGDGNKINVLIMIDSIGGGGAERVACQLASGLADSCNVTLLYSRERGNEYTVDSRVQLVRIPTGIGGETGAYK